MARRKNQKPQDLKALILDAALKIIATKGLKSLTARTLAQEIGYTPGTIYNFYCDMDTLIAEVNYTTLSRLEQACRDRTAGLSPDFTKVRALAYAYADFAHSNVRAWSAIFQHTRKTAKAARLPKRYRDRILSLFQFIENTLIECLNIPKADAARSARLLWASLHGITTLTLDGRLKLIGISTPNQIIDDLLEKYFSRNIKSQNNKSMR